VLADIPRFDDLARRAPDEARVLQSRTDELGVDPVEVDSVACRILLGAEWSNDECARHFDCPPHRFGQPRGRVTADASCREAVFPEAPLAPSFVLPPWAASFCEAVHNRWRTTSGDDGRCSPPPTR